MRIRMSGSYRSYEFVDAVDCIIQTLVANGVDEIRSANIYIRPYCGDQLLQFEDQETGTPFKLLQFQGSRSRPFKPRSPRVAPVIDRGSEA